MPVDTNGANATAVRDIPTLPVSYVPTPTEDYRRHRKLVRATVEPGAPPAPTDIPAAPPIPGARALIWKQDPSVAEIGIRKVFLPYAMLPGPRDARITNGVPGIPPVSPNAMGDYITTPGTDAFDAIHTFAVVRETLTMYQRALNSPLPWRWNTGGNTEPLNVFPHGIPNTMNAFYSPGQKALRFGDFIKPGEPPTSPRIFTCRSLDIVSHEAGHAVLDGLKPGWLSIGNPPQTGGLHESFGDLTAVFLALSQLDQVEAIIAQTKANLHDKTFLADLAEEFGLALGRPNGLRNADNDFKLSEVGTEVHAISQVFTGAIYDILADIFVFERNPAQKDDAALLYSVGQYVCSLVLRAINQAPATAATFAHVANQMLQIAAADGKPAQYRNFIRNRFTVREVVVSPTPLTEDLAEGLELEPGVQDAPGAVQNRSRCCGTMQHPENTGGYEEVERELAELQKVFA
jgi:hypothetical protein